MPVLFWGWARSMARRSWNSTACETTIWCSRSRSGVTSNIFEVDKVNTWGRMCSLTSGPDAGLPFRIETAARLCDEIQKYENRSKQLTKRARSHRTYRLNCRICVSLRLRPRSGAKSGNTTAGSGQACSSKTIFSVSRATNCTVQLEHFKKPLMMGTASAITDSGRGSMAPNVFMAGMRVVSFCNRSKSNSHRRFFCSSVKTACK